MPPVRNRGRPAGSCDHCRARKVRCIRQDHEACQRCLQTGIQCMTNRKRLSRPYYQTTKAQFEMMASIVHHFLPDVSLDSKDLRNAVLQLEKGDDSASSNHESHGPHQPAENEDAPLSVQDAPAITVMPTVHEPEQPSTEDLMQQRDTQNLDFSEPCPQLPTGHANTAMKACPTSQHALQDGGPRPQPASKDPSSAGKSALLAPLSSSSTSSVTDRGSVMLRDAAQVPRYYNRSSYANFFALISSSMRSSANSQLVDTQPSVQDWALDGQKILSVQPSNLPPRSLVLKAARRFFSEINNVVYILDYGRFQAQLQAVFADDARTTNAVLAIVYFTTFLGTSEPDLFTHGIGYCNASLEDGTLETVQAVMLMAFGHLLRGQRNIAWVSLGNAIRIAQSLGLHLHESDWDEDSDLTIESKKMLWWSLFDLDTMLSSTLGRPQGATKDFFHTSIPQDLHFEQNPLTPPGSAKASAELALLHSETVQELYLRPRDQKDNDVINAELLHRLQQWWDNVPLYLKPGCPTSPSYLRTISYLGLRYYYMLLLITQRRLLQTAIGQLCADTYSQRLVETCEKTNRESILLLKQLAEQNLISTINFFDAFYILINGMIMFVRCLKDQSPQVLAELEAYMPLLSLVEHSRLGKFGKESMKALANKLQSLDLNDNAQTWSDLADIQSSQILLDMLESGDFLWPQRFSPDPTM